MFEIEVNKKKIKVDKFLTLIQACKQAGEEIPRFCYHEKLSIAGNCRMCLVEVEKSLKPVASCAMPIMDGMKVYTDTLMVRKAREGVMEYLLSNHPLDCPICDQGGECDLQDQAMAFGNDRGRFYEEKRAVEDKNCGPLIKTVMTRCIHCTRCVRFSSEIAGINDLGVTGRGNSMEIGTYVENMLNSEISGNIIDLCPVGALTSKPYAFVARPWELKEIEAIDLNDSMGSNIKVCTRGNDLMRILPLYNEEINEEWLTDKARFSYDGYKYQRLVVPMIKIRKGKFKEVTWEEAFNELNLKMLKKDYHLDCVLGNNVDLETANMAKEFCNIFGDSSLRVENDIEQLNLDIKSNYIFNDTLEGVKKTDLCFLIGTNIRYEMPLLAAKLRKEQRERNLVIASIGPTIEHYLDVKKLGNSGNTLLKILEGRHSFCSALIKAKNPMFIIGTHGMQFKGVDNLKQAIEILKNYISINKDDWSGLNYIQLGGNQVGMYDLGIGVRVLATKKPKILFMIGVNNLEYNSREYELVIYQGHHGNNLTENADVILPGATVLEKDGLYTNVEGRPQISKFVFNPPGNARNDWNILRGLIEYLFSVNIIDNKRFNKYNTLKGVRNNLEEKCPIYLNEVSQVSWKYNINDIIDKVILNKNMYNSFIYNYYMTNNVTKVSKVMALCREKIKSNITNFKWK